LVSFLTSIFLSEEIEFPSFEVKRDLVGVYCHVSGGRNAVSTFFKFEE
jgi:hypothetical protein